MMVMSPEAILVDRFVVDGPFELLMMEIWFPLVIMGRVCMRLIIMMRVERILLVVKCL